MVCGQHKWAWSGKVLEDATPFINFWILPWDDAKDIFLPK